MSEKRSGGSPVVSTRVPYRTLRLAVLAMEGEGVRPRTRAEVLTAAVELMANVAVVRGAAEVGEAEAREWCWARFPEFARGRQNVMRAATAEAGGLMGAVAAMGHPSLRVGAPSVGVVESSHSPSAEEIAAVLREMEGAPLASGEGTQGGAARREEE